MGVSVTPLDDTMSTTSLPPTPLPQTPSTPTDISFGLDRRDSLTDPKRARTSHELWAGSQEHLRDRVEEQDGHVHGPHCSRSTEDLVSEWEDTDDEEAQPAESEDDDDPRGPRWTWEMPSRKMVHAAAERCIIDEYGNSIPFGSLLPDAQRDSTQEKPGQPPFRRLVVFFVGHWWCGLCHDYALMSVSKLSQAQLIREGVRVALISSGTWKAITKYRTTFGIHFPVYVDRGTRLYQSLGMRSSFPNPFAEAMIKNRPKYHRHAFARQMATGMATGMRLSAFKGSPGNFMQLGGEFVFTYGYKCEFVHRMQGRGDHCEAPDVLQAVGVQGEMSQPLQQLPESITRMKSESSTGSSTLVTRIKTGITAAGKGSKTSVGLDAELKEGLEGEKGLNHSLPPTPPLPPSK